MKNVLIVNQSAELYGADKAILELINNFPENYAPIVVLHEEGPLKQLLEKKGIQVIYSSVIKVKRGILKPSFFIKLPFEIIKSFFSIKRQLKGKKIHLIHSNATSVFIGAFYSFFFRIPHLWHVHEIIEKPKRIALIYPKIIHFFSDKVIFNSIATSNHFTSIYPKIKSKSNIIYNGQERNINKIDEVEIAKIKSSISSEIKNKVLIGLIGRISQIKGQDLMLDAFVILQKKHSDIHLVFIGSAVKGKEEYLDRILKKIEENSLQSKVSFVDFQENIWPYYDIIDITVVPSTEKESFGLVATEAMLSKKPVIAANHGGLVEIVKDHETGLLFEANNAKDLVEKISLLLENPELIKIYGENGFKRVNENFSTKKYVKSFSDEYEKLTR
ncbi:glycosyltransferase family 4 protein [Flavobacterium proteolyticum]|uniref:Glycosyltransferase family 4 protein n=1 Tax=Flavobacterium proteolyticum TaxID=2911683 RepID=A0ABR9WPB2_9FLAO|nr:glycosyltransferase family 4 protein [Flavobacterium proteolyticum]MBE9575747.1 glycosyltransferase family 4 protein [Flavobacterium proteolyticum]